MPSPTLQMDALLPPFGNSSVFDPVFKLASSADCSSSPGSSGAECWGDAELSRKLAAKIRGLEIDIENGQYLQGGGRDSGIENNFDNVQDLGWPAELAAALAPFAQDDGSGGRSGRHDDFDKDYSNQAYRSLNPRFKTEVCRNFKEKGTCLYGDLCQFAHGKHELRSDVVRHSKYKTKLCQKYWIAGYCAYGPRCNFIHQEIDKDEAMRILASGSMDARGFAVAAGPKAFASGHVDWTRRILQPGGHYRGGSYGGGGDSYAGSAGSSDSELRADPDLGFLGGLSSRRAFLPAEPAAPLDLADVANLLPANFGVFTDVEDEPRLDRRPLEGQRGDFGLWPELAEGPKGEQ